MADANYDGQVKVYIKQEGEEQVIANGGKQTVESGGEVNVESGGRVDAESGGEIRLQDGANFDFLNQDITASEILGVAKQGLGAITIANSNTTLSDVIVGDSQPTILPSEYAMIILSIAAAMTNGSCRLPSAKAGQTLLIRFSTAPASVASLVIYCEGHTSGVTGAAVYASTGSALATINMHQSAASYAQILLRAVADGQWSIVSAYGQVTETPA